MIKPRRYRDLVSFSYVSMEISWAFSIWVPPRTCGKLHTGAGHGRPRGSLHTQIAPSPSADVRRGSESSERLHLKQSRNLDVRS